MTRSYTREKWLSQNVVWQNDLGKTCVIGRIILKQFCWQKSAEPCSAGVAGGRRRRRRGWCWGSLVVWIFFLAIPNTRLVSHSSLLSKTNSWLIFGITSHSKMSQLSVLVCGTISVWCLLFMTRLPLVQNLGPYGNGFALLETLYPLQFREFVVRFSIVLCRKLDGPCRLLARNRPFMLQLVHLVFVLHTSIDKKYYVRTNGSQSKREWRNQRSPRSSCH